VSTAAHVKAEVVPAALVDAVAASCAACDAAAAAVSMATRFGGRADSSAVAVRFLA
jgi:hypothetical protein